MESRIEITDHAVQRYVERHATGLSYRQAREHLEQLLSHATSLKTKTYGGQDLWCTEDPPMRFVMKPDSGKHVCVTVLPPGLYEFEDTENTEADEMLAAYERIKPLIESKTSSFYDVVDVKAFLKKARTICSNLQKEIVNLKAVRHQMKMDVESYMKKFNAGGGGTTSSQVMFELKQQLESSKRRYEKQLAHNERQSVQGETQRRVLKIAVKALVALGAREVLDEIAVIEPDFVGDRFLGNADKGV